MGKKKPVPIPQSSNRGKKLKCNSDKETIKSTTEKTPSKNDKDSLTSDVVSNTLNLAKNKNDVDKADKMDKTGIAEDHPLFELIQTFPASFGSKYKQPAAVLSNTEVELKPSASLSLSTLSSPSNIAKIPVVVPALLQPYQAVNDMWSATQPSPLFNHERMLLMLDKHVKSEMFHLISFISSPKEMAFTSDENSICQYLCNFFNVPHPERDHFWMIYAKHVEKKLNQKRSDVSNAMKKTFLGKYTCKCINLL